MRKPKRLAEEERRFHAAHKAKRQRKNSAQGLALVTSHGREPALGTDDDGRPGKLLRSGTRPAVLPENLSYNERLQALLEAYKVNGG
jgi:hypothetical protein